MDLFHVYEFLIIGWIAWWNTVGCKSRHTDGTLMATIGCRRHCFYDDMDVKNVYPNLEPLIIVKSTKRRSYIIFISFHQHDNLMGIRSIHSRRPSVDAGWHSFHVTDLVELTKTLSSFQSLDIIRKNLAIKRVLCWFKMGLSKAGWKKRKVSGGRRKQHRKKRAYERARAAAQTKLAPRK